MIPEREREALMRLTMCARRACAICKYEEECEADDFEFQDNLVTENMNILADALRTADRKTEPQLTPNYCGTCKHRDVPCGDLPCDVCHGYSNYEPKTEPIIDQAKADLERWSSWSKTYENMRKTHEYCDICNHENCENCVADSRDDYCVPSNYHKVEDEPSGYKEWETKPIEVPKTGTQSTCVTVIASMLEDEPQADIHGLTDCDFCKERNCEDCAGGKDDPQTERSE